MIRPFTLAHTPGGIAPDKRLCSKALEVVPISSARRDSRTLSTSKADGSSMAASFLDCIAVSMPRVAAEGGEWLQGQFVAERDAEA